MARPLPWTPLVLLVLSLWLVCGPGRAWASAPREADITLQARYWVDTLGKTPVDEVVARAAETFDLLDQYRSFDLGTGALWMRLELPARDGAQRWFLMLSAAAFTNGATLYARGADGAWTAQRAGDRLPVAQWSHPDQTPLFSLDVDTQSPVWLRLDNAPAPLSPRLVLLNEKRLQDIRSWTFLMVGGYLGFGLLVLFLGWVHVRLYGDRAFVAYCCYVACMLGFQAAFTGVGGLFFWRDWAWWNDAAPALFMLWLTASGIWFVREACALARYHRGLDRFVLGWAVFGLLYPIAYLGWMNTPAYIVLSLYGLLSVLLSFGLCVWAWRRGESYAGWLALGFLPVHLAYPFPALRSAGVLPDGWATQYALLIGSAVEIPLLLYILHRRAKDFNENRTRLRAIESTDPLTGLALTPVLILRLRHALRRSLRYGHRCGLMLVELTNHREILEREGREAGDRALVVAASRLSAVLRDVDTVSRIADTRFAVLVEGPEDIKRVAQHVVAKGLERIPSLPSDVSLRFRLVSSVLPMAGEETIDDAQLLQQLHGALDRLMKDPRKVVLHLSPGVARAGSDASVPTLA